MNKLNLIFYNYISIIMDMLPVELVTIIACDNFDLFVTLLLVPTIGQRLCEDYPQIVAKEKFITTTTNHYVSRTFLNIKLHSVDDQPSSVWANGDKYWHWHNKLHRGHDLPAIEWANGNREWYWKGNHHRKDQPAIMTTGGVCYWYVHGKKHREGNLPAVEYPDGYKEWWTGGKFIKQN